MRKLIFILVLAVSANYSFSQKYMTKTGYIRFFSSAALENIEAHNRAVMTALDMSSGEFIFKVLIKSYTFEKALMQKHFNENYMESDKFPNSEFKGKIIDIKNVNLKKDGIYQVTAEGDLTIHGVTKRVKVPGTVEVKGGKLITKAKFSVALSDYNIKVPKAVVNNIAENIDIYVDCVLEPSTK